MIKMIRTDEDYEGALATVGSLMVEDPAPGTPAADELEVLSGKRQLTLSMIRALHEGLGIPAAVLIRDNSPQPLAGDVDWERFPTREMVKRGWLNCAAFDASTAETCLRSFFEPLGTNLAIAALYRGTNRVRSGRTMNAYALMA